MKSFSGTPRTDFSVTHRSLAADAFQGKTIAILGGTNGIGRAIGRALAAHGAQVRVVGRTFRDQGVDGIYFVQADLSALKNARRVAQQLPAETLDILIFSTGIFASKQRQVNAEGIEIDMATSYLNRFVMLREMATRLGKGRSPARPKPRVFVIGFPGTNLREDIEDFNSEREYKLTSAHSKTVIGNEALVLDAAQRYPTLNVYGLNPGLIKSRIREGALGAGTLSLKLLETVVGLLFPSAERYAETILPLLASPDIELHSGAMFGRQGDPIHTSASLTDKTLLGKIMDASEQLAARALSA